MKIFKRNRIVLLIVLICSICVSSCKKTDQGGITPPPPTSVITGHVFDSLNGESIQNAIMILDTILDTLNSVTIYTDSNGYYRFLEFSEFENHPISAFKVAYFSQTKYFTVFSDDSVVIDFYLKALKDLSKGHYLEKEQ